MADEVAEYRFSSLLVVRLLGTALTVVGVVVVGLVVVSATGSMSGRVPLLVGACLMLLVTVAAAVLARRSVVRLDKTGYRVQMIRGVGVPSARWREVEDVVATMVGGDRVVMLRLRDGRTTTVPTRALAVAPEVFVAELQSHLDAGHGYRRLK